MFDGEGGEPRAQIFLPGGRVEPLLDFPALPAQRKYGSMILVGGATLIHCGGRILTPRKTETYSSRFANTNIYFHSVYNELLLHGFVL